MATTYGYDLDTRFLQKPHFWDPRRVYSTTATDWQHRVDFERMRRERLDRAKRQLDAKDLGAVIPFTGGYVRYVTGICQGHWKTNIFVRYAVLPRDGEPVLFETVGSDLECARIDLPWMEDRIQPAMTWRWAEGGEDMMVQKMADSVYDILREAGV